MSRNGLILTMANEKFDCFWKIMKVFKYNILGTQRLKTVCFLVTPNENVYTNRKFELLKFLGNKCWCQIGVFIYFWNVISKHFRTVSSVMSHKIVVKPKKLMLKNSF